MRYRAVFFDVGETLVHPAPSFPELFAQVLEREGHRVLPEDVLAASRAVTARFSEASRDGDLWTTSPERSRAFWRRWKV
jgi:FMN phosphatase YigB (HAD superfamily)